MQNKNISQHFMTPIDKLGIDNSSLHSNCWFTGFSEGDGGFGIRYTEKKGNTKRRIACRFRLEQRMNDPITNESYYGIMNKISQYLESRVYYRYQKKTGRTYYLIQVSSIKQLQILIQYFEKNPLFSSSVAALIIKIGRKFLKWFIIILNMKKII